MTVPSPSTVRQAAIATAAEGVALVVVALVLVLRALGGAHERSISGYGTAVWFVVMGAALLAAAWALWTGRRWGRGITVFAQLLLLGVAWYVAVGSQRWAYGAPIALVALVTLVLLFSPSAVQWLSQDAVGAGGPSDSASADRSEPDTL
jgi:glucose dehydrogenase